MKISEMTEFGIPVGGAATGLLASKVLPSTLKIESTFTKGGLNIALGVGALMLAGTRDGRDGDFIHYGGLALLSMGVLELLKNFLPVGWQTGIAGVSAYPTHGYQAALSAYPSEIATPVLGDGSGVGMGEPEAIGYPYESFPSY